MPRFQVDVEKQFGNEYWTNRYILEAPNLAQAVSGGQIIVEGERDFHTARAFFTVYRTRSVAENDGIFTNTVIAAAGTLAGGTSYLPLFNVVRVDFGVATGRPSRKFYRVPLEEGMVNDTQLDNTLIATIAGKCQTIIAELAANNTPWVDPQGSTIINPAVYTYVAMRQLRRGSKRRASPVIS